MARTTSQFGSQPSLTTIQERSLDYSGPSAQGISKFPLSASLDGSPILVTTAGNSIHTFPTDTRAIEELYLYASNLTTANLNLSMSFSTASSDAFSLTAGNFVITPINAQNGLTLCYPGIAHASRTSNEPLSVYVKTNPAQALNVSGYVIRYYPRDNASQKSVDDYGFTFDE